MKTINPKSRSSRSIKYVRESIAKESHHKCGAASRQEPTEVYMKTLEVMNQTKAKNEMRTDSLGERQRVGVRTCRITNRGYNE